MADTVKQVVNTKENETKNDDKENDNKNDGDINKKNENENDLEESSTFSVDNNLNKNKNDSNSDSDDIEDFYPAKKISDQKNDDEKKIEYDNEVNPDPSTVETTQMLAKRLNQFVFHVFHDTDWSKIFDLNKDGWKFDISLSKPIRNLDKDNHDAFVISLLSPNESKRLIHLTEMKGYENCGYLKSYRSNTRLITNDKALSDRLYERIKQILPSEYEYDDKIWKICGLNERFRWCKYVKGQKFGTHTDARFIRSVQEGSFYTVNVYLNDGVIDFTGGRTCFFVTNDMTGKFEMKNAVVAEPGLAVIFNHFPEDIPHNGEILYSGTKYLMRTDVMYRCEENNEYY